MQRKWRINSGVRIGIMLIVVFAAIGFVGKKHSDQVCNKIIIKIENQQGNFFINEGDVMDLITNNGAERVVTMPFAQIQLKKLEEQVLAHKFIESAQVYKDLSGNLTVEATQARPIARIFRPGGKDYYVSDRGAVIPVSSRFTARVMMLSGSFFKNYLDSGLLVDEEGKEFFNFIDRIEKDEFWNAQFAQLDVDRKGNITIFPQVTKQEIQFGTTRNYSEKLEKLRIFYEKILPDKGWNYYDRVNLQFKDQIICE